jgi:hypothetical protein
VAVLRACGELHNPLGLAVCVPSCSCCQTLWSRITSKTDGEPSALLTRKAEVVATSSGSWSESKW